MKQVEAYETNDGQVFTSEEEATQHENEVFTAELFEIMKLAEFGIMDSHLIAGMKRLASPANRLKVLSNCKDIVSILEGE